MRFLAILATIAFLVLPAAAQAQGRDGETNFVVTVKAKDAKFVGTAMGGAQVIIRDRRSGDSGACPSNPRQRSSRYATVPAKLETPSTL